MSGGGGDVAPRAGAWVETSPPVRVRVRMVASHPVRVRGLKHIHQAPLPPRGQSHSVRVRGLKHPCGNAGTLISRRTPCGCVG